MVDVTVLGLVLDPTKIEQGAQRAGRAVDDLTAKTDRAARSTDDLQGATGGAGQSFNDMGPKVDRSTKSVDQMGFIAETTTKRLQNLAKASVGIFAFDLVSKVAGFSGAMDVLQKASDAAASAIQRALGIDRLLARLEEEKKAIEANAAAWESLRRARDAAAEEARGPGVTIPNLGAFGVSGGQFISTRGLNAQNREELLNRVNGLSQLEARLQAANGSEILGRLGKSPEERAELLLDSRRTLQKAIDEVVTYGAQLREFAAMADVARESLKEYAATSGKVNEERKRELDALQRINERRRAQIAGSPRIPERSDQLDLTLLPLPTTDFDELLQRQIDQSDRRGLAGYDNFATPNYRSPRGPSDFEKRAQMEQIAEELRRVEDAARAVQRVYDDLGQIGSNAFESFITGAQDARDAVKMLGQDIYLYLVRALITLPLQRALSSGLSSLFPGIGAPLAQFQHGGTVYQPSILMPINGGRPALVAEAGPEEIVPTYGSGRARGGRGGVTIVVNSQPGDTTWRRSLRQVMHDAKRGGIT